ncbi:MAG: 16S rRNA (guanine(966)-N(2))-methyltransferase RsmD [Firmicutes bacterium]|nr:16S rRNA (guanine(966)-N(2))-methyltransferase RsmD [Bacillota bacterium]
MRITGGKYGGLKLLGPTHEGLRPTTDMLREALFNILGATFHNGRVLDLFAGAGTLGIEALSRGARAVTFVEKDPKGLRLLKENLRRLPDTNTTEVRVYPVDALRILPKLSRDEAPYDLIFIDPPFHADLWLRVLELIARLSVLAATGQIVVEIPRRSLLPERIECLKRVDKRVYGEVSLEFWEYVNDGVDAE